MNINNICDFGLHFRMDGFGLIYLLISSYMWLMAIVFSTEYMAHYKNKCRYYVFTILTYLATIGVFLSADLYTTYIFFEIMSFTSYVWVVQDEKKESLRAGGTYLAVAVMGGLVMLMGLFMLYDMTGTLVIEELNQAISPYLGTEKLYIIAALMAFGFGAKAGAFPLHIWLPKAHPVAPAPASALLSGVLTKTGIFGILIISTRILFEDVKWGTLILTVGVITMLLGALLALFSIDIKRTLACSSVSQIGFILVGIGMLGLLGSEGTLAARGTLLHMVNHSMIKLVLFMCAGVVYMNIHALDMNEVRGFGRRKPLLKAIFLMGALGIGGVPLWNGYISKTLLHEAIVEYQEALNVGHMAPFLYGASGMKVIEWIFIISGGITICYMTKLYIVLFVERNEDESKQQRYDDIRKYMKPYSAIVLSLSALFMPVAGTFAGFTVDRIADIGEGFMNISDVGERIKYFSLGNLLGGAYSIVIGVVLYLIVVRRLLIKDGRYINRWPKWLDLEDYLYRPLLLVVIPNICVFICRIADRLVDSIVIISRKSVFCDAAIETEPSEGNDFTHYVGGRIDNLLRHLNEGYMSYHPITPDVEHKMSVLEKYNRENFIIIARSLSYGLFLACIGLVLVLVYMLFM